jgi:hypothetical protein
VEEGTGDDEQGVEEEPQEEENTFGKKWKWYGMIDKLAMGDITKYDNIYKLNYILCLNKLSFEKEKQDIIDKMQKAEMQRQKNKR